MTSVNEEDIFNSSHVQSQVMAMSVEDIERYKKLGEELHKSVDFVNNSIIDNQSSPLKDSVSYLCNELECGLHPCDLEENDHEILRSELGEDWYTQFGYVKEDLTNFVTFRTFSG